MRGGPREIKGLMSLGRAIRTSVVVDAQCFALVRQFEREVNGERIHDKLCGLSQDAIVSTGSPRRIAAAGRRNGSQIAGGLLSSVRGFGCQVHQHGHGRPDVMVGYQRVLFFTLEGKLRKAGQPRMIQWDLRIRIVKDLQLVRPAFDVGQITYIFRERNSFNSVWVGIEAETRSEILVIRRAKARGDAHAVELRDSARIREEHG